MSVVLFFGASLIVVLVSTVYVAVGLWNLLKKKENEKESVVNR